MCWTKAKQYVVAVLGVFATAGVLTIIVLALHRFAGGDRELFRLRQEMRFQIVGRGDKSL
jgi:hypothetical protein